MQVVSDAIEPSPTLRLKTVDADADADLDADADTERGGLSAPRSRNRDDTDGSLMDIATER